MERGDRKHKKRPKWATIVGILGIVFGCFGILGGAQGVLMPKMIKMQKEGRVK